MHSSILKRVSTCFLAATKQLYEWYFMSVCHIFLTMFPSSYHHEISRSYYKSKVHAKGQGQRSMVKETEVTTQLNRSRTVTPVWIHIWWWNDAYSLMLLGRCALLFSKVIRQISRSLKIVEFDPDRAFPDCNSSLNSSMATKWCTKLEVALKRCPIVFSGHTSYYKVTWLKKPWFWPKLAVSGL